MGGSWLCARVVPSGAVRDACARGSSRLMIVVCLLTGGRARQSPTSSASSCTAPLSSPAPLGSSPACAVCSPIPAGYICSSPCMRPGCMPKPRTVRSSGVPKNRSDGQPIRRVGGYLGQGRPPCGRRQRQRLYARLRIRQTAQPSRGVLGRGGSARSMLSWTSPFPGLPLTRRR